MTVRASWQGAPEFVASLRAEARHVPPQLVEATGRAGVRTAEAMRQHVQAMIYSQPRAKSGYVRTGTLMRSVHAARPDAPHDADEDRARNSDLMTHDAREAASVRGTELVSEIGSWTDRGYFAHEGVNQPEPRPFVNATESEAEQILADEMEAALSKALGEK